MRAVSAARGANASLLPSAGSSSHRSARPPGRNALGRSPCSPRARGFSLIECLVALVVLSIGLMGMASLALTGLRTGRGALFRTQAVNLVSDMVERIRANPAAGEAYDCSQYAAPPAPHDCAPTGSVLGASCTPAELAEDDLAGWQRQAGTLLPLAGGDACAASVAYFPPAEPEEPARYRVKILWVEPGEPAPLSYGSDLLLVPPR